VRCFRLALFFIFLFFPHIVRANPFQITDAIGRTLTVSKTPVRIVSLAPSITETLFALGLDREIIGVTIFCNYPPQAKLKPKVGGMVNPNLETLLAMKPDLVIAVKDLNKAELAGELDRLGIPMYVSDPSTVSRILEEIRVIGRIVGKEKSAEQLFLTMKSRIEAVKTKVRERPPVTVLYVLWGEPLMTIGPGSYIDEMIRIAGGKGIVPQGRPDYTQLSMEEVLAKNPEVIIFASEMGDAAVEAERKRWLKWNSLKAVKERRLYRLDSDLIHRPGPRLVEGISALAGLIHPELFPEPSEK
jgi:iron complex transport system substrate-binding protein